MTNKHIKKKFLSQGETVNFKPGANLQELDLTQDNQILFASVYKDKAMQLTLNDTGEQVYAFIYKDHENKYFPVLLPDFSLCYFNFAYFMLKELIKSKDTLEKNLSTELLDNDCREELYSFYGYSSAFIIHLFTSLESFINSNIHDSKSFPYQGKSVDKEYVMLNIGTIDKIKCILKPYYGKDFLSNRSIHTNAIYDLKKLRDELIHMKYDSTFEKSSNILDKLLKFKYEVSLDAVAKLMNFYKPNYVEACNCGKDF